MLTNDNDQSPLQNFDFNDDVEFFGIKNNSGDSGEQVIREVKKPGSPSTKAQDIKEVKTVEEQQQEEEDIDFFNISSDKNKSKEKKTPVKTLPDTEEDDEDDKPVSLKDSKNSEDDQDDENELPGGKSKEIKPKSGEGDDGGNSGDDIDDYYKKIALDLKAKGILRHAEIKDDDEITEDRLFELHEEDRAKDLDEGIDALIEKLDDDGKRFIKFKRNGGETIEFILANQSNYTIGKTDFDSANEKHVETALIEYLTTVDKLDAEELKDRLDYLKDSGKDKKFAEKYHTKLVEDREKRAADLDKKQADIAKARTESSKLFNTALVDSIGKTENVGKITITEADKKKLPDYMTKPIVKVGKDQYIPKFQAQLAEILSGKTPEAQAKLVALAKLIESDFNPEDLVVTAKTKATKEIRSNISQHKDGTLKGKSPALVKGRDLASRFDEDF